MSLRRRIALASAGAVAIAIVAASVVIWFVVRGQLYSEVDQSLRQQADRAAMRLKGVTTEEIAHFSALRPRLRLSPPPVGPPTANVGLAVVTASGKHAASGPSTTDLRGFPFGTRAEGDHTIVLADPATAKAVAAGKSGGGLSDDHVKGVHLRVLTIGAGANKAIQDFRPLTEVDRTLSHLRWILLAISVGGVGLAALLGRAVSRNAARPVLRLTQTAELVSQTRDLSARIPADEGDELGRLAEAFNTMLAALESSQRAQRQLVADASHELRTPLTSLRMNLELLADGAVLPTEERQAVLTRAVAQIEELTVLVGDLVDLAREDPLPEDGAEEPESRLDLVAADAVRRAESHAPGRAFDCALEPCLVRGAPERLARAVGNLLDNALKWGPRDEPVEVRVSAEGDLRVRDHGPGIAPEDLTLVFDRFYRAAPARGLPGSGLGLAIVRQVAETCGGRAWAELPEGGGALLCMRLPVTGAVAAEDADPQTAAPALS